MGSDTVELRVLQVIGTTDAEDRNLSALDLHHGLTQLGVEVRTLALAPGRTAGLAAVVPSMAPTPRSLSAHTQFRREQRWADVVVLHGAAPAGAAGVTTIRNAAPTIVVLGDDAARWREAPVPSRAMRVVSNASAVVVGADADADMTERLGLDPSSLRVMAVGVAPGDLVSANRRQAARGALGLDDDAVVAYLPATGPEADAVIAANTAMAVQWSRPGADDGAVVHFGGAEALDRTELALAAADLVVHAGEWASAPSRSLLMGAAAGLAPIAPRRNGFGDLVDDDTGWESIADALDAGADQIHRRGAVAAQRVSQRFNLDRSVHEWADLLDDVARR